MFHSVYILSGWLSCSFEPTSNCWVRCYRISFVIIIYSTIISIPFFLRFFSSSFHFFTIPSTLCSAFAIHGIYIDIILRCANVTGCIVHQRPRTTVNNNFIRTYIQFSCIISSICSMLHVFYMCQMCNVQCSFPICYSTNYKGAVRVDHKQN